jgi:hypothetical protein
MAAVAAVCVLTVLAFAATGMGLAAAVCALRLTTRFALAAACADVSVVAGAAVLVSVVPTGSSAAGCVAMVGGGSLGAGCASWDRTGAEESARAAAIAGQAPVRA